jgi:hypothetical protein
VAAGSKVLDEATKAIPDDKISAQVLADARQAA